MKNSDRKIDGDFRNGKKQRYRRITGSRIELPKVKDMYTNVYE